MRAHFIGRAEEASHLKYGHDAVVHLATGTPKQREMIQAALNRWWPPIMTFFGPSDKMSTHTENPGKMGK